MKIDVVRRWFNEKATIGEMFLDGDILRQCYTLEDVIRDVKVAGATAIPYGTYEVVINYSNRFKRLMPRLMNVPNYEGVLIHNGNTSDDTDGCILVGRSIVNGNFIGESRGAFNELYGKLVEAQKHGKMYLTLRKWNGV